MAFQQLSAAPAESEFTPLAEHESQTPTTFFGGKPVLYQHSSGLTLTLSVDKLSSDPAIAAFDAAKVDDEAFIKDVAIWVTSESLLIFQSSSNKGVTIPFPSIALHATMKWKPDAQAVEALYMNLSLNDAEDVNDEDDFQMLELTILPPKYDQTPEVDCINEIYEAMNKCADLHPDPNGSDMDEEADETAPGATGWITAENMDQFVDADGNFTVPVYGEELGPGAGTVRPREEDGDEEEADVNGVNGDGHETKYHRTD